MFFLLIFLKQSKISYLRRSGWSTQQPHCCGATLQRRPLETATVKTAETSVWTMNPDHQRTSSNMIPVSLMKTHSSQTLLSRETRRKQGRLEPGLGCWAKKTQLGGKPVEHWSSTLMTTKWNIQWRSRRGERSNTLSKCHSNESRQQNLPTWLLNLVTRMMKRKKRLRKKNWKC